MKISIHQVDAFTDRLFGGNPAAVCALTRWLDDAVMQAIAAENNLSETAFFVPAGEEYDLRWFTPTCEIDLCGHATLATAHVILSFLEPASDEVVFATKSGLLRVTRGAPASAIAAANLHGSRLRLELPRLVATRCAAPAGLAEALGAAPRETWLAQKLLAVFDSEEEVRALQPDMAALMQIDVPGVIVTAPGVDCDFVSRFFGPRLGVPEDPVTGSAHCTLVPHWAARLGKSLLHARQVSARGGELFCEDLPPAGGESANHAAGRVALSGGAVTYLQGTIEV